MSSPAVDQPTRALFDRWAEVYDSTANPLLMLEEQMLPPMLPSIRGLRVVDVGCGTGRWLSQLETLRPASLLGIDSSTAMLRRARVKLAPSTRLVHCDASALPVRDSSLDLILSSFVISYLGDLTAFALKCACALKPGAHIVLSDMHPHTAQQRCWTRSFVSAGERLSIAARSMPLPQIIEIFARDGLELCELQEPLFQPEQREIFTKAGKLPEFEALANLPAIYLLKLRKTLPERKIFPTRSRRHSGIHGAIRLTHFRW